MKERKYTTYIEKERKIHRNALVLALVVLCLSCLASHKLKLNLSQSVYVSKNYLSIIDGVDGDGLTKNALCSWLYNTYH